MWSAHYLHGVLDMTPLIGFFGVALALAGYGIAGRFCDRCSAMTLEHLPRDGVNLGLGCHLALLMFHQSEPQEPVPPSFDGHL
jgi:hypothetical protein